jgi:hypothetical protein
LNLEKDEQKRKSRLNGTADLDETEQFLKQYGEEPIERRFKKCQKK